MCSYLVVDLDTGAMDGWYAREEDARAICERFRERGGRWALLRAVSLPEDSGISDRVWHAHVVKRREQQRQERRR